MTPKSTTEAAAASEIAAGRATDETRLGLTILPEWSTRFSRVEVHAYFANVDETTHQVLVAERVDSILCLLPRCVFHNPVRASAIVLGD